MRRWLGCLLALLLLLFTACSQAPQAPGPSAPGGGLVELPSSPPAASSPALPSPESLQPAADASQQSGGDVLAPEADAPAVSPASSPTDAPSPTPDLPEDGSYTTKEDVALYIHLYGRLPANFITKREAQDLGWSGGSLEPYAPGMCIGGSRFGNYEGLLPDAEGRTYTECDIDTLGAKSRGAKRIVFSNDGLIYYTEDHYASFELLYGEADDD